MRLILGDCVEVMAGLDPESIDAVVTDPPAGIGFMGKGWDHNRGGRDQWVEWMTAVMAECYRLLKPGGHAFVWALPWTSHWTAWALESAGFEVRDCVTHIFGSGFPKSLDVSKAIDREAGAEREVIGSKLTGTMAGQSGSENAANGWKGGQEYVAVTAPATPEAERWDGWGTAMKPATEHWWLARKPLVGTVAANVLRYGTGAINVDGCRVATTVERPMLAGTGRTGSVYGAGLEGSRAVGATLEGRWPPNIVFTHSPGCERVGERVVQNGIAVKRSLPDEGAAQSIGFKAPSVRGPDETYGAETVGVWHCEPGCPVAELDAQSGASESTSRPRYNTAEAHNGTASMGASAGDWTSGGHDDAGGASRFFPVFRYEPKAARSEREAGLDGFGEVTSADESVRVQARNSHP